MLPIFVDIERFRTIRADPALDARFAKFPTKLLVVSRLEREKNVALAMRSFAYAAPLNACLIIVGDGGERTALEKLARDEGLTGRAFFEGERDAAPYYLFVDLVLVPSRYEGYGLVIVEALAAGKPVLSTDVGIAREAGAIVTTSEKFAERLAQWFKNGSRTAELKNYPYKGFDEYVRAYCEDVLSCVPDRKGQ